MRRAPFDAQCNLVVMKVVGKRMADTMDEESVLFTLLYEDIVRESPFLPK